MWEFQRSLILIFFAYHFLNINISNNDFTHIDCRISMFGVAPSSSRNYETWNAGVAIYLLELLVDEM